ncbi:MAG: septum formation inhibitor Maf [Syntrophobacterales bacterium]|nr:MAG: septum formation inhibitor Maf [Syntrophobacterales bacterium]
MGKLILASSSPRRQQLLRQIGLEFDVVPSEIKEDFIEGESPQDHVLRLAEAKAHKVGAIYPHRWVIGADTAVSIDGMILGKPQTDREAYQMLSMLSGRDHLVVTGVSVYQLAKGKGETIAVETSVRIKTLEPEEITWYIRTGEPFDKAGGYAIQGRGAFMVQRIEGSYTNVVGLPLCELLEVLNHMEAIDLLVRS